jgi:hypothetical protein
MDRLNFFKGWGLKPRLRRTTSIRVGLPALGIPFVAPTGKLRKQTFREPLTNGNSVPDAVIRRPIKIRTKR